jgi:hypothetical protein
LLLHFCMFLSLFDTVLYVLYLYYRKNTNLHCHNNLNNTYVIYMVFLITISEFHRYDSIVFL